jgi:hypothetical protein
MNCLDIFEKLSKLSEDPEAFEEARKGVVADIVQSLPEEKQRAAEQYFWVEHNTLSRIKDPTARMNVAVANFWKGVGEFQRILNGGD